jgi:hypothetical protein
MIFIIMKMIPLLFEQSLEEKSGERQKKRLKHFAGYLLKHYELIQRVYIERTSRPTNLIYLVFDYDNEQWKYIDFNILEDAAKTYFNITGLFFFQPSLGHLVPNSFLVVDLSRVKS